MKPNNQAILDAALALPEGERAELVQRLLASLTADVADVEEEEFLAELDRRSAEGRSDPGATITWSELKAQR